MSIREELDILTIDELKRLDMFLYNASRILNNDRKKLTELSLEGRDIALSIELLSTSITSYKISKIKTLHEDEDNEDNENKSKL